MVLRQAHGESSLPPSEDSAPGEENCEAPSPFIDGTRIQYAWDASTLELLKRCPRLYFYTAIENWQGRHENVHLRWGSELHMALEDYEHFRAGGVSHDDSVHDVIRALLHRIEDWTIANPNTKGEGKKTKENLLRAVVWYLDHYEQDEAKTVILENGKPAVELSFQIALDWEPNYSWEQGLHQPYILCGHLDKIVEFQGDRYVMDHKSTTTTPGDYWFKTWSPHNQMSAYTIAGQLLMKSPIKGVIVDAVQVADTFSRPVRGFTMRSAEQLEEWLSDTKGWLRQAERYAEANYWPMNDTACDKYGGCKFREVCAKSPTVRDKWLAGNFTQENERWNPLKSR